MKSSTCFLFCIKWPAAKRYLLWVDGSGLDDYFVLDEDGHMCIFISEHEAERYAQQNNLDLKKNDFELDMVRLQLALVENKRRANLLRIDCRTILNGWNSIEDMVNTLKLRVRPYQKKEMEQLQQLYEKIVVGADILESMGADYATKLSRRESACLSSYLRTALNAIRLHENWGSQMGTTFV